MNGASKNPFIEFYSCDRVRPCLIVLLLLLSSHARGVDNSIFYCKWNHNSDMSENSAHAFNVSIFYYPIEFIPYIKLKSHSMMSRKYVTDIMAMFILMIILFIYI